MARSSRTSEQAEQAFWNLPLAGLWCAEAKIDDQDEAGHFRMGWDGWIGEKKEDKERTTPRSTVDTLAREFGHHLVGGLETLSIFHILGIIIPTDFHIFQRGGSTTNQPFNIRFDTMGVSSQWWLVSSRLCSNHHLHDLYPWMFPGCPTSQTQATPSNYCTSWSSQVVAIDSDHTTGAAALFSGGLVMACRSLQLETWWNHMKPTHSSSFFAQSNISLHFHYISCVLQILSTLNEDVC